MLQHLLPTSQQKEDYIFVLLLFKSKGTLGVTVKVLISPFLIFVVNISGNHQMTLRKEEHIQGQYSGTLYNLQLLGVGGWRAHF